MKTHSNSIQLQEKASKLVDKGLVIFYSDYEYEQLQLIDYETILFFIYLYKNQCWKHFESSDLKLDIDHYIERQTIFSNELKHVFQETKKKWNTFEDAQIKEYLLFLDTANIQEIEDFSVFFEYMVQTIKYFIGEEVYTNLYTPLEIFDVMKHLIDFNSIKSIYQPEGQDASMLPLISNDQKFVFESLYVSYTLNCLRFLVSKKENTNLFRMSAVGLELKQSFDMTYLDLRFYREDTYQTRLLDIKLFINDLHKHHINKLCVLFTELTYKANFESIKSAIQSNVLETIVELPDTLMYNKFDKLYLLIFSNIKIDQKVQFVNLEGLYINVGSVKTLDLERIYKDIFTKRNTEYIVSVSNTTIEENRFDLDSKNYLSSYYKFNIITSEINSEIISPNLTGRYLNTSGLKNSIWDYKLVANELNIVDLYDKEVRKIEQTCFIMNKFKNLTLFVYTNEPIFIDHTLTPFILTTSELDINYFVSYFFEIENKNSLKNILPGIGSILSIFNLFFIKKISIAEQKKIYAERLNAFFKMQLLSEAKKEVQDENDFLRHTIAGRISNINMQLKAINRIVDGPIQEKYPEVLDFKHHEKSKNTFQSLLGILMVNADDISSSLSITQIDRNNFSIEHLAFIDYLNDYLNQKKFSNGKRYQIVDNLQDIIIANKDIHSNTKVAICKKHFTILLDNICINAEKHGFETLLNNKLRFELLVNKDQQECILMISNTGKSIQKDISTESMIMKGSSAGKNAGSGVGLYMVNEIIQLLNGTLEITNLTEGVNKTDEYVTTVAIRLPLLT